jgi:transcriptional regulator with XRE-family HTH domain
MRNRAIRMDKIRQKRLGDRIAERRRQCGFSRNLLEKESGVRSETIKRYEAGNLRFGPRLGILLKLCKAMGCSTSF